MKIDEEKLELNEEFFIDEKLRKRNISEQKKIDKILNNLNQLQELINYYSLNGKINLDLMNYSDYYLKRLFEAKLLELSITIMQNYFEVNKFNFNFDKLKKLKKIVGKLVGVYTTFSQKKAIKRIKELIKYSDIDRREI
ncbi:MAG: hypothetical protein PHY80_04405 [Rickettsiales bacterium]|nr:hypothetical protein [Rickettsiales bacterium]